MYKSVLYLFGVVAIFANVAANAQFEWARVGIVCPCSLVSEDGKTATLQLGLRNFEEYETDNLYATIAVTGEFTDENYLQESALFLGTAPLNVSLDGFTESDIDVYSLELGTLPSGQAHFELLVHEGPTLTDSAILDFIWFEEKTDLPFTTLDLKNMDFLTDSDGDGVDDVNERLVGTDPANPNDVPNPPEIDVVVSYLSDLRIGLHGSDPVLQLSHIMAVTNYIYQSSGIALRFRVVGMLDEEAVPSIQTLDPFLPDDVRDELLSEYGADVVIAFQPSQGGLCGIAQGIGGWRAKGFIHPSTIPDLIHSYFNPLVCPTNVTAHEIGHLLGLGHSYLQGDVGTYTWSRGHGRIREFATVMTYHFVFNALALDKFSSPELDCHGHPCGVPHTSTNHEKSADAVRSANITKYQLAANGTPPATLDVDGDGYAATDDRFPLDPSEWNDADGDGYGDNRDEFPLLPHEWSDTDGDGLGDNSDRDIDGDGVQNAVDSEPFDSARSNVSIAKVHSSQVNDMFGKEVVRTGDWDRDGFDDLAIAAPQAMNINDSPTGVVYLLSFSDFADLPLDSDLDRTQFNIEEKFAENKLWTLHGVNADDRLGDRMAYLPSVNVSGHLVVSSNHSVYMIRLDNDTLTSLDRADGNMDRRTHLEFCNQVDGCWYAGETQELYIQGIVPTHDRNNDGESDFAVLASRLMHEDISVYLLTTSAIRSVEQSAIQQDGAFNSIVANDADSFRIYLNENPRRSMHLENLGDVTGFIGHELGVAMEGVFDPATGQETSGKHIVLNIELAWLLDLTDGALDGQVRYLDFLNEGFGTYEINIPWVNSTFGRSINTVSDVDEDGRPELMLWSGSAQSGHLLISSRGLETLDANSDGKIELSRGDWRKNGIWQVGFFTPSLVDSEGAKILNSSSGYLGSQLLAHQSYLARDLILAPLEILNNSEFTITKTLPGIISLEVNVGYGGIKTLRLHPSLRIKRTNISVSGMVSLDDLDGDDVADFMFAVHRESVDGGNESSINVLYSASLASIDRADGNEDGVAYLHNNLDDTDGDGVANIRDRDDDGDGVDDILDKYPLVASESADTDGDLVADGVDACPNNEYETDDFDGDGKCDQFQDFDIDEDGIIDFEDEFPRDTDNDGFDNDIDLDDDNDGVPDLVDAFPLDPDKQSDRDGDGIADKEDLFADDASDWYDFDMDGIGDNADTDDDNDGYTDAQDRFPFDSKEWIDTDDDGVGDNADVFPENVFEWADVDEDGVGDNVGMSMLGIYRIESDWFGVDSGIRNSKAFDMRHFGLSNSPKMLIQGGIPQEARGALHILSQIDLHQLDLVDQKPNHMFDFVDVARGSESWEFRGVYGTSGRAYVNNGALADIDNDGVGDFVIGGPSDDFGAGSVYVVRGSQLHNADRLDGRIDGKINHTQCAVEDMCIAIRDRKLNIHDANENLGLRVTSLRGLAGPGSTAVVASILSSVSGPKGNAPNPMMYVFQGSDLLGLESDDMSNELRLQELRDSPNTLEFFTEFPSDTHGPTIVQDVVQLADYDDDGIDDMMLSTSTVRGPAMYFVASSDILNVAQANGHNATAINMESVKAEPNSYRIDSVLYASEEVSARRTPLSESTSSPRMFPLATESAAFLVDIADLATLDAADGDTDGIIANISPQGTNSFQIEGLIDLNICDNVTDDQDDVWIFGTFDFFNNRALGFRLFSLGALRDFADSLDETHHVNIDDAVVRQTPGFWTVNLGTFENRDSYAYDSLNPQLSCIGDWDNDGIQDIAIAILRYRPAEFALLLDIDERTLELKSELLLLMSRDLQVLDRMDGSVDQTLNLSILWRDTASRMQPRSEK